MTNTFHIIKSLVNYYVMNICRRYQAGRDKDGTCKIFVHIVIHL